MKNTVLHFDKQTFECLPDETVLECLLRNQQHVPYGCRAGACQSCLLIAEPPVVDPSAQRGLSVEQLHQGAFLSCQCRPHGALHLRRQRSEEKWRKTELLGIEKLSEDILQITLDARSYWQAGQYFTLSLDGEQARCFSAAGSAQVNRYLTLQLRLLGNGAISGPLSNATPQRQAEVWLGGPFGDCVFDPHHTGPLLLIGRGTGLAPARAIVQQAIHEHHPGSITLFGFGRSDDTRYWQSICSDLPSGDLNAIFCADDGGVMSLEDVEKYLKVEQSSLRDTQVYIFGGDDFVKAVRRQCALGGVPPRNIRTEIFVDCSPNPLEGDD
jgi:CDP-4-dehydro-6-deoxyglucose reductase, E3